jgi:hypothetical protein
MSLINNHSQSFAATRKLLQPHRPVKDGGGCCCNGVQTHFHGGSAHIHYDLCAISVTGVTMMGDHDAYLNFFIPLQRTGTFASKA